jgi:hypothetical protein
MYFSAHCLKVAAAARLQSALPSKGPLFLLKDVDARRGAIALHQQSGGVQLGGQEMFLSESSPYSAVCC